MAQQTIKHRRGPIESVKSIADFRKAELIIATGSVDGKFSNPVVMIADPDGTDASGGYRPVSRLYTGAGQPSLVTATFGNSLDGLPYYDSTAKKLFILGNAGAGGHTEIQLTGSSINNFDTDVSASAAAAGFGAGGGGVFEIVSGKIFRADDEDLQITGSMQMDGKYALRVSQSIHAYNINAGYPTSNDWGTNLDGSYFDQFTPDTDVSEILRFVAGLLSASAPDASPNTRTYNSVSDTISPLTAGSINGRVPQSQTDTNIEYLLNNGFATAGSTLFSSQGTVRTATNINAKYTSGATGGTQVSSSAPGTQLFGLGSLDSGNASVFKVKGTHTFSFYSSSTAIAADQADQTSGSNATLQHNAFSTSVDGLTIGKIETVNPAVIPAGFQDGKFVNVHQQNIVQGQASNTWHGTSLTNVSSSGQYKIESTIGIATGSQVGFNDKSQNETIFWAPISTIDNALAAQNITAVNTSHEALTLDSGSLSGAPFINVGTWKLTATASGVFSPLYSADDDVVDVTIGSTTGYSISNLSGNETLDMTNGTIGNTGMVTDATGTTVRTSGTVPHLTDLVEVDAIYQLGNGTTFQQARALTDTSYTLTVTGKDRSNIPSNLNEQTVNIHTAGTFGQGVDSGSMGVSKGQTSSTVLIERFNDETYRRTIGAAGTLNTAWDNEALLSYGDGEGLQVKPGFLVNPESNFGYWYVEDNYNSSHYKWYLREFDTATINTGGDNLGTLTITLAGNPSLTKMKPLTSVPADSMAIAVIFEGSPSTYFDIAEGTGGALDTSVAPSAERNPFSTNINTNGKFTSAVNNNGVHSLGLRNIIGQVINGTNTKIWLLVRYKGKPSTSLTQITVSAS